MVGTSHKGGEINPQRYDLDCFRTAPNQVINPATDRINPQTNDFFRRNCRAYGISDSGIVVGVRSIRIDPNFAFHPDPLTYEIDAERNAHAFIAAGGLFGDLEEDILNCDSGDFGCRGSAAFATANNIVVGWARSSVSFPRAFRLSFGPRH